MRCENEPAWIQMKPAPRDAGDHTGPDLTEASSMGRSDSRGVDSSSVGSLWTSTSSVLTIDGDADSTGVDMICNYETVLVK